MTTDHPRSSPLDAMRIPEFRSLVIGRFIFIMGLRMMSTLVGWWIYNLTNAPLAIGIVGLSEFIPAVSLALYAGHIIDLSEKRKLMLTGVGLYAFGCPAHIALSTPIGTYTSESSCDRRLSFTLSFSEPVSYDLLRDLFSV